MQFSKVKLTLTVSVLTLLVMAVSSISDPQAQVPGTGGGYELSITNTGKVRSLQSHNQHTTAIGSTTITTGTWRHVAGVWDGNQMRVYLNGVLDGSVWTTNGPASGNSPLKIGVNTGGNYYFGGLIDFYKDAKNNPNHIGWSSYWHQAVNNLCFSRPGE